jgi:hypothetical protein
VPDIARLRYGDWGDTAVSTKRERREQTIVDGQDTAVALSLAIEAFQRADADPTTSPERLHFLFGRMAKLTEDIRDSNAAADDILAEARAYIAAKGSQ